MRNIIKDILLERANDFSWTCFTPDFYEDDDYDDYETEEIKEEEPVPNSPTFATLTNIRNLCDNIHVNLANSGTSDESFLMMELIEIENKLRSVNDTLNSLQNYNNNQQQILTGDIVLT